MADKEITIKVTANTDDAEKKISKVAENIDKMSNAGSGKASEELDKVTESATEAETATEKLVSSWNEYKQKVRDAEAEVRKLNAAQFESTEQRDAAINALGDKLDDLVYEGKAIEDSVKAIGVDPESLQGFESVVYILERANKEFEIALNHKEKLMNQPTAPDSAFVTTNPWEEGPDGGGPAEFKARMEEMRAELESYAAQMGEAIAANDRMKSSLEAELSALDSSSAGYTEQKKLLEGLISACDSYAVSSESQRQSIQKQKDALDELNAETLKSEKWDEGLKAVDKYGNGVVSTSLKVQKSIGAQAAIQSRYENAVASAQERELKGARKVQAAMEVAGKSREELIRLVEQYSKAMSEAQSKEEHEAAAAGLAATRKQLTLITREANLTGQAMIGSQTSVQGLVTTIGRLGVQGRLTFKALNNGVKMFAKSTLVLAGIQFAWEALSKVYEKVKGDLFGVADAEEYAARKAEELATAAKEAADNLNNARFALMAIESDKKREDAAREFAELINSQNDEYREQIKLVDETLAANLRLTAATAKGEEREIAYEKLRLQEQRLQGMISEYDYQRKMIDLESKAAEIRRKADEENKKAEKESAFQKYKIAEEKRKEADEMALEELGLSPEELQMKVSQILKDEADISKHEGKYERREKLTDSINKKKDKLKSGTLFQGAEAALRADLKKEEEELAKLNDELHEVDGLIDRKTQMLTEIPEAIKDALLSENKDLLTFSMQEHSKNYRDKEKYNASVIKQRKDASDESKRAEEVYDKANDAWLASAQANAEAATWDEKINTQRKHLVTIKEDNEKANEKHEKKKQKLTEQVQKMEYSALLERAEQAKVDAELALKGTPDEKRRRDISNVYSKEIKRRKQKAAEAEKRVVGMPMEENVPKNLARNIRNAGNIAEDAVLRQQVDLDSAAKALQAAVNTKNKLDNAAAMEMYKVVQSLLSETQKQSREYEKMKRNFENLARAAKD